MGGLLEKTKPHHKAVRTALVALGGNLDGPAGQPADGLMAACQALAGISGTSLRAISRFYRSAAFPAGSGPDFVNACAVLHSTLPPAQLLTALHGVEARLGRVRNRRWGARTVDLDLIAMEDAVCPDIATQTAWQALNLEQQMSRSPDQVILPHPRMQDRAFVLVPLADIAPRWRHPVSGLNVMEMLAKRPADERASVRPFTIGAATA